MYIILYRISPTASWRAFATTFVSKELATNYANEQSRRDGWARAVVKYVDVVS